MDMDILFIGIKGHVVAINKSNGEVKWKTRLKHADVTNVLYEDGKIFAYAGGHLYKLDATTGVQEWQNPLKGLGFGTCIFAGVDQSAAVVTATQMAAAAGAAAGAASTGGDNGGGSC